MSTIIDVRDAPAAVKIRHVDVFDAEGVKIRTDTPAADYCWLFERPGLKLYVSGDYPLPCILGASPDNDPVAGTLTKVNPETGAVKYGPGTVRRSQVEAWIAAKVPGVTLA
jgi:hypothetical protein